MQAARGRGISNGRDQQSRWRTRRHGHVLDVITTKSRGGWYLASGRRSRHGICGKEQKQREVQSICRFRAGLCSSA